MTLDLARVFPGDSEMSRRMRAFDWSTTLLGPAQQWPQSLRTAVSFLLASKAQIVLFWGPELTTLYNDAYAPVYGGKHPGVLGLPVTEAWSEIWETGLRELFEGVLSTGEAYWARDRPFFLERFGYTEETFFDVSYDPVRGENGEIAGIMCIVSEMTRRVIGERRMKTLREVAVETAEPKSAQQACEIAASLLVDSHDVPFALIYLVDDVAASARMTASTGIDPHSSAAPATVDLSATDERPNAWPFRTVLETGQPVIVNDLRERFGALSCGVWPEAITTGLVLPVKKTGQDRLAGFLVAGISPRLALDEQYLVFYDLLANQLATAVASARAYEEERRRAAALEELDRAKTAFFSNVSHEFRTPLTLMLGPLEDALASVSIAPAERASLDVAHRNGLRLLRLVNTLLDFSRIEAGRTEAMFEAVDAAQLTADLASVFRSATERAGLFLEVDCQPPTSPVFLDRDMWEKIVLNLLSNAFKFTLQGGITVSFTERDGFVNLVVADTGTGIPAAELSHVFERFHRVRGTEGRTHEGTGIGLALVSELVKLHGGHVTVASELGRGSTFTVSIPTGSAHIAPDRIGAPRHLTSTALGAAPFVEEALRWLPGAEHDVEPAPNGNGVGTVSTAGATLLVVDDNADMRSYLVRLLSPYWQVETAADGEEALRCIQQRPPDLVLSDVMMPRVDGIELTRALRRDPQLRSVPVILVSARAGEESRVQGVESGADDYLTKPFSARELVARVNANLEMARMRTEADKAIRHRAEQFVTLLNEAPVGVYLIDADFRIREVNPVARPEFGDIADLIGRDFDEMSHILWPPTDADEIVRRFRHTLETGEPHLESERVVQRLDRGGTASYEWQIHRILLPDGRYGVVCYSRDISEQVQVRQQREQLLGIAERARLEAERANAAKDNFLAVLSHELRSPMNAMLGWLRILKTAGARDPDLVTRAVDTLERNIWIQAQVINDLLDVSRIMSGKLELERAPVDLASVVTGCVESLRPSAEGKQVALRLKLESEHLEVIGDSGRLQQVVVNLLGNAIKFTDAGGFITVSIDRGERAARVIVEDTGSGIAPEFLPHLFERFSQAESATSRRHGGLGLGLAIVKNLVALHGGSVDAESEGLGRGARFTVTLPIAEDRQRLVFRGPVSTAAKAAESLSPLNVLVVEDDVDSREALELALKEKGARVRSAASVRHAIEAYIARPPDLMISDISMPGEDGYALIRAIREREEGRSHRTLAIAVTGFAGRQDREMALRAGYDDHMAKPVELDLLLERVRVLEATRTKGLTGGVR